MIYKLLYLPTNEYMKYFINMRGEAELAHPYIDRGNLHKASFDNKETLVNLLEDLIDLYDSDDRELMTVINMLDNQGNTIDTPITIRRIPLKMYPNEFEIIEGP